jgi:hypothetical protein
MKTKHLTKLSTLLALLVLPAVSFASVYQYIDTSGNLQSIDVPNSTTAIATAPNIAQNSGVRLGLLYGTGGSSVPVTVGSSYYQYINTSGNLESIDAPNSTTAIATAPNIAQKSGVILVNSDLRLTN